LNQRGCFGKFAQNEKQRVAAVMRPNRPAWRFPNNNEVGTVFDPQGKVVPVTDGPAGSARRSLAGLL